MQSPISAVVLSGYTFGGFSVSPGSTMNAELYRVPTLALLSALVAVFGALWLEGRSHPIRGERSDEAPPARRRQLLWLAGWICAVIGLAMQVTGWTSTGLGLAISDSAMQLTPLMFLASLAPQYLIRTPRILYVVAFGLPVMVYAGVAAFDPQPGAAGRGIALACAPSRLGCGRWPSSCRNGS